MNTFNLTFWGEILQGKDPQKVKSRFAKLFDIKDPDRLEHFFSGETIILRRNLDRKVAGEYYSKLRKLGVEVKLVKVKVEPDWAISSTATAQEGNAQRAAREKAEKTAAAEAKTATRLAVEREKQAQAKRRVAELEAQLAAEKEAEATALRQAQEQQQKQQAAAQKKAQQEEDQRRAALAEAQRKAKLAEEKRRKQEAAEKKRTEQLEAKRKAAEAAAAETARRKAVQAKEKRLARDAAKKKKQALEEEQRKAAIKTAERDALLAEKLRREREATVIQDAQRAEQKRIAKEVAAKLDAQQAEKKLQQELAEKNKAAQEAASRKAAREEQKRVAKAEQQRLKEQRIAQEKSDRDANLTQERQRQKEHDAQRQAMEEQSITRAAHALTAQQTLKPTKASVKSRLELPRRNTSHSGPALPRQSGAPNFYQLHPFRSTAAIKERAALAEDKQRQGFTIAAVAIAALLLFGGFYFSLSPPMVISGAESAVVDDRSNLLLLTADQLLRHDRSGVGIDTITLDTLSIGNLRPPMLFYTSGELLVSGRLLPEESPAMAANKQASEDSDQLLLCNLEAANCRVFSGALSDRQVRAMDLHPLTGELFLLDQRSSNLLKLDPQGSIQNSAKLQLPEHPVLRLDSGLLFMNSASGPAISVYRYEDNAFGRQLDEILLLPPAAVEKEQTRVWDFARSADSWWVVLYNPDTQSAGLYRFDSQWNYLSEVALQAQSWPRQLLPWGEKLLVIDPEQMAIQRFNSAGVAEVPLTSNLIGDLRQEQQSRQYWERLAWTSGLLICLGLTILSLVSSYLNQLRGLVYRARPARGAEPIDDLITRITWIESLASKARQQKLGFAAYSIIVLSVLLICIGLGASTAQLVATLIALCGPLAGLIIISRSNSAHVGTLDQQLILVDHTNMYHLASGSRLQYRGPFLLIDDVVVFTGAALIPALDPIQMQQQVSALVRAGVRVDYKTVIVKLLQSRHPLAQAGKLMTLCLGLALCVLMLGLS